MRPPDNRAGASISGMIRFKSAPYYLLAGIILLFLYWLANAVGMIN